MSCPAPYGVCVLALSHANAWRTAVWTGLATAVAADLALEPSQWTALAVLSAVCASTVRMTAASLVESWLQAHPDARAALGAAPPPTSEFGDATRSALRTIAGVPVAPPP